MILIFLYCAFRSGRDRYYLKKAADEAVEGKELLYYFRPANSISLLVFYLNLWLRRGLILLLCFFPCGLSLAAFDLNARGGGASLKVSTVLLFSAVVFFVNGIYFFVRFNSFLFLARYYFASGKYPSAGKLFSLSYKKITGKRGQVLKKRLSFIGWFLSCLLIFPSAFVRSYYSEAMARLAKELIEE